VDVHLLEPGGPDRYFYQEPLLAFARSRAPAAAQPSGTR
jgi:hypothetical protein